MRLVERGRQLESAAQVDALRRGMSAIVPRQLFGLLSGEELEQRLCGKKTIDLELLKRHTEYSCADAVSAESRKTSA